MTVITRDTMRKDPAEVIDAPKGDLAITDVYRKDPKDPFDLSGTSLIVDRTVNLTAEIQGHPRDARQLTIQRSDFAAIGEFARSNSIQMKVLMNGLKLNPQGEIKEISLFGHDGQFNDLSALKNLKSLKSLSLCSKVMSLQGLPEGLESLQVTKFSGADLTPLDKLRNLNTLSINFSSDSKCTSITSLPDTLKSLKIHGFQGASLDPLSKLDQLEYLGIRNSPNIASVMGVPKSLQFLEIKGCENLGPYLVPQESFYEFGKNLGKLEILRIEQTPALESLKGIPTNKLKFLFIHDTLIHGDQTPHLAGAKQLERVTAVYNPDDLILDKKGLTEGCCVIIDRPRDVSFYEPSFISAAIPVAMAVGTVIAFANPPLGVGILLATAASWKLFPRTPTYKL